MATTGSTVLGSCDDLNAIADVCEKYGIWMHVDVIFDLTIKIFYLITKRKSTGVLARLSLENDMSKVCSESTHLGNFCYNL